jgi:hypothetical protein
MIGRRCDTNMHGARSGVKSPIDDMVPAAF